MRLRRQAVSASSWVSWVSVGVAGLYSSRNWGRGRWEASESSVARTWERLVSPWVRAFREERCLPASVRGPVERSALARLAWARGVGIGFVIWKPPMWFWHERAAVRRPGCWMLLGGSGRLMRE